MKTPALRGCTRSLTDPSNLLGGTPSLTRQPPHSGDYFIILEISPKFHLTSHKKSCATWSCFITKPQHLLSHLRLKTQHSGSQISWNLDHFQNLRKGLSSLPQKNARISTKTTLDSIFGKSQDWWLNSCCSGSSSSFSLHLHSSHLTFLPHLSVSLSLFIQRTTETKLGPSLPRSHPQLHLYPPKVTISLVWILRILSWDT